MGDFQIVYFLLIKDSLFFIYPTLLHQEIVEALSRGDTGSHTGIANHRPCT